ncbi:MAG: leucine-rich repeat domain-containing protein, partial [Bacillota bacterium]|nr:leucine-rich repeat domain-containing protein [Bacillota bacterium]
MPHRISSIVSIILILSLVITGCSPVVIVFEDVNLENAIREAISKPTGDITVNDVDKITELKLEEKGISDITPLKYFSNLTELDLDWNPISDISALSSLTKLTVLDLGSNYQISDISALSGLTKLTKLDLSCNQISNISALSSLTNLTELYLGGNQISDIST